MKRLLVFSFCVAVLAPTIAASSTASAQAALKQAIQEDEGPKSVYRDLSLAFAQRVEGVELDKKFDHFVSTGDIKKPEESKKDDTEKEKLVEKTKEEIEKEQEKKKKDKTEATNKAACYYKALYDLFAFNDEARLKACLKESKTIPTAVNFSKDVWHDLRLFSGDRGTPLTSLASKIRRTQTKCGYVFLEKLLANPIGDIKKLQKRQALLKRLVTDDEFYKSIQSALAIIKKEEQTLLSMWSVEDPNSDYEHLRNDRFNFYWEKNRRPAKIAWWNLYGHLEHGSWRRFFDRSPILCSVGVMAALGFFCKNMMMHFCWSSGGEGGILPKRFTQPVIDFFNKASGFYVPKRKSFKNYSTDFKKDLSILESTSSPSADQIYNAISSACKLSESINNLKPAAANSFKGKIGNNLNPNFFLHINESFDGVKDAWKNGQYWLCPWRLMNEPVRAGWDIFYSFVGPLYLSFYFASRVRDHYRAFKRAYKEVWSLSRLAVSGSNIYENLKKIDGNQVGALELMEELSIFASACKDAELNSLSSTLRGKVYSPGSLVHIYKRIAELKQPFSRALEAVGEIDAFCSLATLYRERANSENKFCFPEYKVSKTPVIDVQEMWDPLTGADEAVSSSMCLGKSKIRNAIISGPNAGGKSTFMRGMLFSVVMAQTCGIVPAASARLTPFSYIDSYVNVEDDPVAKKSLFRMQAYRVSSLIKNIESLETGKHAIVIADEME